MPSTARARFKFDRLNVPGLTPHEVKAIEQQCDAEEARENSNAVQGATEEKRRIEAQVRDHEAKGREKYDDLLTRLKDLRSGRLSAKAGLDLIAKLRQYADYIEGDGDRWVGVANTYEGALAKLDEIAEDPGAYMDTLYSRYPALQEGRFQDADAVMAALAHLRQ